ncbi:polysaccharide deacetylase family protein [Kitasatospora sp. NPDC052896]|uniref:polysaccharide deacetylase family protein n=1 Tax=Kitasatospora sp. NPDC052896 TaxID=3364061 RepID=UPI0037CC770E
MTLDRRSVLRSTAQLAALAAAGGLLSDCGPKAAPAQQSIPADPSVPARPFTPAAPAPAAAGHPADPLFGASPAGHATEGATAHPFAPGGPSASPSSQPTQPTQPSPAGQPSQPPLAPGTPVQVVNGPRTRPQVALTFHGQGDPDLATALLETAEQHGARLTVLAVGTWLDEQPQMAKRVLDGGHELGNHTLNHLDINGLPPERAFQEISGCADRLRALTGSTGRWFRPSAAQFASDEVLRQARLVGYQYCLSYDLDPIDYSDPGADAVEDRVLDTIRAGSIVALHMGHPGTLEALPAILDGLADRGLTAVTASRLCS